MSDFVAPKTNFNGLKNQNLKFIKAQYPELYQKLVSFDQTRIGLQYIPKTGDFDIIVDGKGTYFIPEKHFDGVYHYAEFEANALIKEFEGNPGFYSYPPAAASSYCQNGLMHTRFREYLSTQKDYPQVSTRYDTDNIIPLSVFIGVGSGLQIQTILNKIKTLHCVIVEPSLERFATSLFFTDWQEIHDKLTKKGRSMHLLVDIPYDAEAIFTYTWNHLVRFCPLFPITTNIVTHGMDDVYKEAKDKILKDSIMFMSVWGYYDDEINQLVHTMYNIKTKIPELVKPEDTSEFPILIIGSGPSLNAKFEEIRELKDKAIIVSCGTALEPLYFEGIQPDFHIELESQHITFDKLSRFPDPEFLKNITLIGPSQLYPKTRALFGNSLMYFKDENMSSYLFGDDNTTICYGTPTCTNSGLAIFLFMEFKSIYLYGMDFGFKTKDTHHADGTVYETDLVSYNPEDMVVLQVENYDGENIYTTPYYYTAKRNVEIQAARNLDAKIMNLSNGAKIENTTKLRKFVPTRLFEHDEKNKQIQRIYNKLSFSYKNLHRIQTKFLPEVLKLLEMLAIDYQSIQSKEIDVISKLQFVSWKLEEMSLTNKGIYFFTRGTIWQMSYILYTNYFIEQTQEERDQFLVEWKEFCNNWITELSQDLANRCDIESLSNLPDEITPRIG